MGIPIPIPVVTSSVNCCLTAVVQDGFECAAKTPTVVRNDAWFLRHIDGRRWRPFSGR